jgi:hypothetical protein
VTDAVRAWLEQLEPSIGAHATDEALVSLAFVAGRAVAIADDERRAAVRRALLVLAAGGDLRRDLTLADPAVDELARDLDDPRRRAALGRGVRALRDAATSLVAVEAALARLAYDPALAWRAYACALLADELGEQD